MPGRGKEAEGLEEKIKPAMAAVPGRWKGLLGVQGLEEKIKPDMVVDKGAWVVTSVLGQSP